MNDSKALRDVRMSDVLTFLEVTRRGSISSAAREIAVTPSQVSKAVVRLEKQLKIRLLARGAQGIVATDEGLRVIPHFKAIVERLALVRGRTEETQPILSIAAPSYLLNPVLPRVVEGLPGKRVRALQLAPALIRAYATQNLFDVAVVVGEFQMPNGWVTEKIGLLRKALFAAPATAAVLGDQAVPPSRLRTVGFISPVYSFNGEFVPVEDGCPMPYSERQIGHEVQTIGLGLELAARSDQLVFGPVLAARPYLDAGTLVEVRVQGWQTSEVFHLACSSDRVSARVQRTLLSVLRAVVEELG